MEEEKLIQLEDRITYLQNLLFNYSELEDSLIISIKEELVHMSEIIEEYK